MADQDKKGLNLGAVDFLVGIAFVVIGIGALTTFGPYINVEGVLASGLGAALGVALWFAWLWRRGKLGS